MRTALRVIDALNNAPDIEVNNKYQDFLKNIVLQNPTSKEMLENITASHQARDHF
jgi:hypothetical protein